MIAVDTNILVYAHREDSPWHDTAYSTVVKLAEGRALWLLFVRVDDDLEGILRVRHEAEA